MTQNLWSLLKNGVFQEYAMTCEDENTIKQNTKVQDCNDISFQFLQ